jgi:hypothetical protein
MWLNGEQVFHRSNIVFRAVDSHHIARFTFRSFHGGSGPKWGASKTQYQLFDNILVQEGECPPGSSTSGMPLPTARPAPMQRPVAQNGMVPIRNNAKDTVTEEPDHPGSNSGMQPSVPSSGGSTRIGGRTNRSKNTRPSLPPQQSSQMRGNARPARLRQPRQKRSRGYWGS